MACRHEIKYPAKITGITWNGEIPTITNCDCAEKDEKVVQFAREVVGHLNTIRELGEDLSDAKAEAEGLQSLLRGQATTIAEQAAEIERLNTNWFYQAQELIVAEKKLEDANARIKALEGR